MNVMVRRLLRALAVAGVTVGMLSMLPGVRPPASGALQPVQLALKIVTVKVAGQKDPWPEYVPARFTLPPHALVQVTVRDFDDGAADIPPGYEVVRGTVDGTMRVFNGANATVTSGAGTIVKQLPMKKVAHTLTVVGEGFYLNVPMPPLSTVVFSIKTPGPGTYPWQCMAACGTGEGGWGGPMAKNGWMQGAMVVR